MADQDIFPDMDAEDILAEVREMWDLDRILPWPKFDLSCPVCGHGTWHPRYWRLFKRRGFPTSRVPFRCDVGMKCTKCSLVFTFGVAIPEEVYEAAPDREQQLWWRDVKHIIFDDHDADRFEEVQAE